LREIGIFFRNLFYARDKESFLLPGSGIASPWSTACGVGILSADVRQLRRRNRGHQYHVPFAGRFATGVPQKLGLKRMVAPVRNCRRIGKKDMVHNSATPDIKVDPETYEVRVDGKLITCEPARVLPLAQRYFLF